MKRCNVYEVMKCVCDGGYVVWSCTTHDRRKIRLIDCVHCLVGSVSESLWQKLVNSEILVEVHESNDKYGTKYCTYEVCPKVQA